MLSAAWVFPSLTAGARCLGSSMMPSVAPSTVIHLRSDGFRRNPHELRVQLFHTHNGLVRDEQHIAR